MVLIHALVTLGRAPLVAAHLDHGWRAESADQAAQLLQWTESLGISCHIRRAGPMEGNLEEAGRKARIALFKELFHQEGCQALLLAHHAGDQAETVAKRVLEGASFQPLAGMRPVSSIDEIPVWRPLLSVPRSAIEQYASAHRLCPIDDPCNRDPRFLRPRLRHQLLPQLTKQLGKEVANNLCRLGSRMALLSDYLDRQLQGVTWHSGWLGDWIEEELHPIEWEFLLRQEASRRSLHFSAQEIDLMVQRLFSRQNCVEFEKGEWVVIVDRGRLFFLPRDKLSRLDQGNWELTAASGEETLSWKSLWQNRLSVTLPPGEYRLDRAKLSTPLAGHRALDRWFAARAVPSFLRGRVPVLWSEDRIVADFLSGGYFGKGQTVSIFLRDAL
jgi:tRNA(Ile)-lysidine synthase